MIGKFKDEVSGIPINEFIGLRSKMYSYLKDSNECGKTAKGMLKMTVIKMFFSTINKYTTKGKRYNVKDIN